jgi:FtsH-binding integral membrane protein
MILLVGLFPLIGTARTNANFRETLLHWLTAILIACLVGKIAISIAAFVWGLRRNAIMASTVGWIVGSWLVCGLFVAGYAGHVCNTVNQPGLRIWVALGGFLLLPLADLAIAPLALAWNRHR